MKKLSILALLVFTYSLVLTSGSWAQLPGSLANGLLVYYPFEGDFNDYSGNGNTGAIQSGADYGTDRFGNSNSALRFISETGYAISANPLGIAGNQDRSVSFWAKAGGAGNFLSFGDMSSTGGASNFLWNGVSWGAMGQLDVLSQNADAAVNNLGGSFFNSWHHVTYVYSGSVFNSQIYLDGVLQTTVPYGSDTLATVNTPLTLGFNNGWINDPNNLLDDVLIYSRALSSYEVTDLYNTQSVPEPSTYALLLLSGAASLWALKRRKS